MSDHLPSRPQPDGPPTPRPPDRPTPRHTPHPAENDPFVRHGGESNSDYFWRIGQEVEHFPTLPPKPSGRQVTTPPDAAYDLADQVRGTPVVESQPAAPDLPQREADLRDFGRAFDPHNERRGIRLAQQKLVRNAQDLLAINPDLGNLSNAMDVVMQGWKRARDEAAQANPARPAKAAVQQTPEAAPNPPDPAQEAADRDDIIRQMRSTNPEAVIANIQDAWATARGQSFSQGERRYAALLAELWDAHPEMRHDTTFRQAEALRRMQHDTKNAPTEAPSTAQADATMPIVEIPQEPELPPESIPVLETYKTTFGWTDKQFTTCMRRRAYAIQEQHEEYPWDRAVQAALREMQEDMHLRDAEEGPEAVAARQQVRSEIAQTSGYSSVLRGKLQREYEEATGTPRYKVVSLFDSVRARLRDVHPTWDAETINEALVLRVRRSMQQTT